jgi:hypothetical protein
MRDISSSPRIANSKVLDIAAIKYLVSDSALPAFSNLKLRYHAPQIFIYENLTAWDDIYFAKSISKNISEQQLMEQYKNSALIDPNLNIDLSDIATESSTDRLLSTRYKDRILIKTITKENRLLVISENWHPQWKGLLDGKEHHLFRTNEMFMGAVIPPGEHNLEVYFDNNIYYPGILISIFIFLLFIFIFIF